MENSKEAALKGPHSFTLARMLAVFWHLMRAEGGVESESDLHTADIFMQISSLVSLRLLSRVRFLASSYRTSISQDKIEARQGLLDIFENNAQIHASAQGQPRPNSV